MRIPIVRPKFPPLFEIMAGFKDALDTGNVTNNGGYVREFERQLTDYLGAPTLAFNNGQTALITMLMAAGIRPGDEVICPSFTFCGTVHAIAMLGAKPVFFDINEQTLTIDPRWPFGRRTTAILGVDVYGICCDYAGITKLAYDNNILALFDSAPAFGSLVDGKPTGSFGDAQIFSFHATKPFSTMEGGALCTNNLEMYDRARRIRNFGQTVGYGHEPHCTHVGLNGKMLEVCAIIGIEQLRTWKETHWCRLFNSGMLREKLRSIPGVTLINQIGQSPIWTYFPILVERRDEVLAALHAKGIEARKYYQACHLMKPYETLQPLPGTERVASQVIALPLLADMTEEEMNYICETLEGAVK